MLNTGDTIPCGNVRTLVLLNQGESVAQLEARKRNARERIHKTPAQGGSVNGRLSVVLLMAVLALGGWACGGGSNKPEIKAGTSATAAVSTAPAVAAVVTPAPTAAPTATPAPEKPTAAVAVVFLDVSPKDKAVHFVGTIRNDSKRSIEGMKVRWDASDEGGALVGGFASDVPPLAAGTTFEYVGGASGVLLTGLAKTVKLVITDPGKLSDVPSGVFAAATPIIAKESFSLSDAPEYSVTADVTTGAQDVKASDISVTTVLKDAAGNIVGANFDRPASTLPETVPAGTKFKALIRFTRTTATPASADFIAYAHAR